MGFYLQGSILYDQQFLETYIELSEPNRNPSSVTLAGICSLVLMGLQNCSIHWCELVALIMFFCQLPNTNVYGIMDLVLKGVGFRGYVLLTFYIFLLVVDYRKSEKATDSSRTDISNP